LIVVLAVAAIGRAVDLSSVIVDVLVGVLSLLAALRVALIAGQMLYGGRNHRPGTESAEEPERRGLEREPVHS
jgi:hypothetical protein